MTIDYIAFSNLIIDDIVFPDGRSSMNVTGGSGLHALVGMRVWSDSLGYAASVGADLDQKHLEGLVQFGVDVDGLVLRDGYATARAWQIFEEDDTRIEIFRTSHEEFDKQKVTAADLPVSYRKAKGFHIQWGSLTETEALVRTLRENNPQVKLVLEATPDNTEEGQATFKKLLPNVTLFAPDREEASEITGKSEPEAICDELLDWGAPMVAIRMGARGSMVKVSDGQGWILPAVPTDIVDVTGAGNSYCGGFVTGLGDGLSPLEAALRAVVSASFALEQLGLPEWKEMPVVEAKRRLEWARERVKPMAG
ncbi:MAG: sugar/nucleoside kinase (ribokinase family) [Candidatus Promineifilaceae bacterium]|jgi:sugar/nucleoside kinase (ribokinase family)